MPVRDVTDQTTRPDIVHMRYPITENVPIICTNNKQSIGDVRGRWTSVLFERGEFVHQQPHHVAHRIDNQSIGFRCYLFFFTQRLVNCLIGFVFVELLLQKFPRDRSWEDTITKSSGTGRPWSTRQQWQRTRPSRNLSCIDRPIESKESHSRGKCQGSHVTTEGESM